MAKWKVERRGGGCAACKKEFVHHETIQSVLEVAEQGLLRQDFCAGCWQAGKAGEGLGGELRAGHEGSVEPGAMVASEVGSVVRPAVGSSPGSNFRERFWWSSRHQEVAEKAVRMDLEVLDQLFDSLAPCKETRLQEIRYVVCLLLLRKRRLKVMRVVREQGSEAFLVKKPRLEELHRVEVFDFVPERMESLRHELQALLDGAGSEHDTESLLDHGGPVDEHGGSLDTPDDSGSPAPISDEAP
jgi:hypothetical protein